MKKNIAPCRRTKPSPAQLRTFRQNIDSDPDLQLGKRTKLGQNLLSLQLPLYERIMNQAPAGLNTLIASGDVYIRSEKPLQDIPNADVVCYGLWVNPSLATHHGVFVSDRKSRRFSTSCYRNLLLKSWKDYRKLIFS